MPEWMRSQFMAPVYALVISFAAALLLGAAMHGSGAKAPGEPTTQVPNAPAVRLVTPQVNRVDKESPPLIPATELRDASVRIYTSSGKDLKVGKNGEVRLEETAKTPVTFCVALPQGWEARTPEPVEPVRGLTCWELAEPAGEIELVVAKRKG